MEGTECGGARAAPFPSPRPPWQRPGAQTSRAEPEPASRGPTGRYLAVGAPGICLSEGQPCPLHTGSAGRGKRPGSPSCSFSRKGKNPGPGQRLPGWQPASCLHTSIFPKRDPLSRLLAWGRGDSAGKPLGHGLTLTSDTPSTASPPLARAGLPHPPVDSDVFGHVPGWSSALPGLTLQSLTCSPGGFPGSRASLTHPCLGPLGAPATVWPGDFWPLWASEDPELGPTPPPGP